MRRHLLAAAAVAAALGTTAPTPAHAEVACSVLPWAAAQVTPRPLPTHAFVDVATETVTCRDTAPAPVVHTLWFEFDWLYQDATLGWRALPGCTNLTSLPTRSVGMNFVATGEVACEQPPGSPAAGRPRFVNIALMLNGAPITGSGTTVLLNPPPV